MDDFGSFFQLFKLMFQIRAQGVEGRGVLITWLPWSSRHLPGREGSVGVEAPCDLGDLALGHLGHFGVCNTFSTESCVQR